MVGIGVSGGTGVRGKRSETRRQMDWNNGVGREAAGSNGNFKAFRIGNRRVIVEGEVESVKIHGGHNGGKVRLCRTKMTSPLLQSRVQGTKRFRGGRRAWSRGSRKTRVRRNVEDGRFERRRGRVVGHRKIIVRFHLLFRLGGRGHDFGLRWTAVFDRALASGDAVVDAKSAIQAVEKGVVTMGADVHVEATFLTHFAMCRRMRIPTLASPGLYPTAFHSRKGPLFRSNFKSISRIVGQGRCKVRSKTGSGNSVRTLFARGARRKGVEKVRGFRGSQRRAV
jgi:hypothetical protein